MSTRKGVLYIEKFQKDELSFGRDFKSRVSVFLTCMSVSFPDLKSRIQSFKKRLKSLDKNQERLIHYLMQFCLSEIQQLIPETVFASQIDYDIRNTYVSFKDKDFIVTLFLHKRLGYPIIIEKQ